LTDATSFIIQRSVALQLTCMPEHNYVKFSIWSGDNSVIISL